MALDKLPDSLLDFVVELAGWNHGWRLEVVSRALRAASAVCVARRLGTCRWTGERGTAAFQPRWRHCAVAKRCGPYLLQPGNRSISEILGRTRNGDDGGGNDRYATFEETVHANLFDLEFVARRGAEMFVVERVPDSTDGRILSLQHRQSFPGEAVLSIDHNGPVSQPDGGPVCLIRAEYDCFIGENPLSQQKARSQHFRTQWLLHCECRTSHLPFRRAKNALHFSNEPRRGNRLRFRNGEDHFYTIIPHWELLPAALPEDEMFFEFEHAQL